MRTALILGLAHLAAANILPRQENPTVTLGVVTATKSASPTSTACANASDTVRQSMRNGRAYILPSLALDCLQSIEVDRSRNLELLEQLRFQLETLSTLGYLKNPPAGYLLPGVDLVGAFDQMRDKLRDGSYTNQYHFMVDLANVYSAPGEGHFGFNPWLMTIFNFQRSLTLVSVSTDGIALPKVYDSADFDKSRVQGYNISEIVSIDGVPVQDMILQHSARVRQQDPDAKYNDLLVGAGVHEGGNAFSLAASHGGIPDEHTVQFANGSTVDYFNVAEVRNGTLEGIETGNELHRQFVRLSSRDLQARGLLPGQDAASQGSRLQSRAVFDPKSESPFISHKYEKMYGYLLAGNNSDVCVVAIPTFSTDEEVSARAQLTEARRFTRDFIKRCKEEGRTRLVIDVSGNGGGNYEAGVEFFRNFFPKNEFQQLYNWRASPSLLYYAKNMRTAERQNFYGEFANANFDDIMQPSSATINQDTLTKRVLVKPSGLEAMGGEAFSRGAPTEPPFKAEDIIILSDGTCASTCAGIVSLFYREAGVRVIALGGRPLEKPMQAMGGTRGGFVIPQEAFVELGKAFEASLTRPSPPAGITTISSKPLAIGGPDWVTNWNNEFAVGSADDAVPLQFVYEAAHCRRFYRPENMDDPRTLWTDAADVAWRGARCVRGSTVNANDTIGKGGMDGAPRYSNDVRSRELYAGPGQVNGGVAPSGTPPSQGSGGSSGTREGAAGAVRVSMMMVAGVAAAVVGVVCA